MKRYKRKRIYRKGGLIMTMTNRRKAEFSLKNEIFHRFDFSSCGASLSVPFCFSHFICHWNWIIFLFEVLQSQFISVFLFCEVRLSDTAVWLKQFYSLFSTFFVKIRFIVMGIRIRGDYLGGRRSFSYFVVKIFCGFAERV